MAAFTLTFGDCAENHVGMQQIGTMASSGFSNKDLKEYKRVFEKKKIKCELVEMSMGDQKASVLVMRQAASLFAETDDLLKEQEKLEYDTKAYMRGRVVNKHARYNICFSEEAQEPDYENKKGRIVAYKDVPFASKVRKGIEKFLDQEESSMKIEGNHYFDISKCGIGFHGDAERRKVVALRLGESFPLHYQWFYRFKPVGERVEILLDSGDMYIMSEKAAGCDWRKSSIYTLRHAAGCKKYLTIVEKKKPVAKKPNKPNIEKDTVRGRIAKKIGFKG